MITQQFSYPEEVHSGIIEEMMKADVILPTYDIFLMALQDNNTGLKPWNEEDAYIDVEHALAAFNGLVKLSPQETIAAAIGNLGVARPTIRLSLVSGIFPYIYPLMPDPTDVTWMIANISIVRKVGRHDYHIEVLFKKIG